MAFAAVVRRQIEAALEQRIPAALTPVAKVRNAVHATGIGALDELLGGGLPEGAVSEVVGPEGSGRTAVALSFVARMTREGKVCAWVDVSDALDPVSAAAAGVDLRRLLWVRCGVAGEMARERRFEFRVPEEYFAAPAVKRGLHGGGFGGHPRGEVKGLADAVGALGPRCAEPVAGAERKAKATARARATTKATTNTGVSPLRPTASGRDDSVVGTQFGLQDRFHRDDGVLGTRFGLQDGFHRDDGVLGTRFGLRDGFHRDDGVLGTQLGLQDGFHRDDGGWGMRPGMRPAKRPWGRMEQAMRAADLLLQAGGFGAVVIDMGSLKPEFVARVPLATWFRYRAAAERTRASVVLLTQVACAKSSAEVVLRMEAEEILAEPTVFAGLRPQVEVVRQRFSPQPVSGDVFCRSKWGEVRGSKVVPIRPLHEAALLHGAGGAVSWESRTFGWSRERRKPPRSCAGGESGYLRG